jgi:two-component system phosphate regulon response regulator OmpR
VVEDRVARVRVLLADDNKTLSGILRGFLQDNGYEVAAAHNGQEVLTHLAGDNFDVLVTDLAMPGIGGADLIDFIRDIGVPLPVIVISGYVEDPQSEWMRDLGVRCALAKPFDMQELLVAVEQATAPVCGGGA